MGGWRLLLLCLLTCAGLPPSSPDPDDEACLTHLSESLQDPNKNLRNWTRATFANPCSGFTSYIQGATCNNGRIYKLSLTNLSLKGSISPYLSNCTNLQSLDLSSNGLTGPIPPELQYLVNLALLNLSANRLSGDIPQQLAFCAYLNVIDLHDNLLTGQIPQQLGLLVRLSVFDVSNNRLSGPIPALLGNRSGNLPRFNASVGIAEEKENGKYSDSFSFHLDDKSLACRSGAPNCSRPCSIPMFPMLYCSIPTLYCYRSPP